MAKDRAVLTIATGKMVYLELAVNLARSFYHWNASNGIIFQLVTDRPDDLPADLREKVQVISVTPGEFGTGFSPKLSLDRFATREHTLFVDSDCLIFGDLTSVFDRFEGRAVSVVGAYIAAGDWFGNVEGICRAFGLPCMPKFNGGIYYLERSALAAAVYGQARTLEKRYDQIGFIRLRDSPNDEVLMALSMALHDQGPIPDDGTIMGDPQACPGGYRIDVLNGMTWLYNPPAPDSRHCHWYPFTEVSPVIVHFLGSYTQSYPYRAEVHKLRRLAEGRSLLVAKFVAWSSITVPGRSGSWIKDRSRPLFRVLFGVRKISLSDRL